MGDTIQKSKNNLYIVLAILFIASLAYRLLGFLHFEQTSILFIGIPALIALLIIRFTNKPKNLYGIVFRVITLFLLLSSIALGEGLICILMAAPIFYGAAALLVFLFNITKEKNEKTYVVAVVPVLLFMAQVWNINTAPPIETVSHSILVDKKINLDQLNNQVQLTELPTFFKLGFPIPTAIQGQGLAIGDTRIIPFESSTKGIGTLTMQIVDKSEHKISLKVKQDASHIAHWLSWKKAEIKCEGISRTQNKITWTSSYTCDLGPQWYFRPMEKYAVGIMNEYLLGIYFKP